MKNKDLILIPGITKDEWDILKELVDGKITPNQKDKFWILSDKLMIAIGWDGKE
jgi:hypothetical protein